MRQDAKNSGCLTHSRERREQCVHDFLFRLSRDSDCQPERSLGLLSGACVCACAKKPFTNAISAPLTHRRCAANVPCLHRLSNRAKRPANFVVTRAVRQTLTVLADFMQLRPKTSRCEKNIFPFAGTAGCQESAARVCVMCQFSDFHIRLPGQNGIDENDTLVYGQA